MSHIFLLLFDALQYFPTSLYHDAFQLNFYSFRKINRERNVWIYKHKLFHRDRPDDLHRVRRRTCPGVDGRKQRFSRFSARKLNQFDDSKSQSSDDESSLEETSVGDELDDEKSSSSGNAKKRLVQSDSSSSKRTRRLWNDSKKDDGVKIDTSIVSNPAPSPTSVFEAHESLVRHDPAEGDDDSSTTRRNERMEMIEQSIVVSEVAMKLEEYARKALRGRGGARTRRNGGGVVTPPFGSSRNYSISSRGLLTYDDELEDSSGVVTDGDDSTQGEDSSFAGSADTNQGKTVEKAFLVAPVSDAQAVKSIAEGILSASTYQTRGTMVATSAVAEFCMTTPPKDDGSLGDKILHLISSCDKLAFEFQLYRGALRPLNCSGDSVNNYPTTAHGFGQDNSRKIHGVSSKQVWDRDASKNDAVRDFKTFAVNCIQKVLIKKDEGFGAVPFIESEATKLQYTADVWLKSL